MLMLHIHKDSETYWLSVKDIKNPADLNRIWVREANGLAPAGAYDKEMAKQERWLASINLGAIKNTMAKKKFLEWAESKMTGLTDDQKQKGLLV